MSAKRRDKLVSEMLGEENVITPSELVSHDLPSAFFGGYNKKAADELLERAADVIETLGEQVRLMRESNMALNERLEEHRQMESTLRSAIVSSQKFGEEILESARREADALVREAEAKRAEIELDTGVLPEALRKEIRMLEDQRSRLQGDLSAVIEAHSKLIEASGRGNTRPDAAKTTEMEPADDAEDESPNE